MEMAQKLGIGGGQKTNRGPIRPSVVSRDFDHPVRKPTASHARFLRDFFEYGLAEFVEFFLVGGRIFHAVDGA